jgi:hypothetical protein
VKLFLAIDHFLTTFAQIDQIFTVNFILFQFIFYFL